VSVDFCKVNAQLLFNHVAGYIKHPCCRIITLLYPWYSWNCLQTKEHKGITASTSRIWEKRIKTDLLATLDSIPTHCKLKVKSPVLKNFQTKPVLGGYQTSKLITSSSQGADLKDITMVLQPPQKTQINDWFQPITMVLKSLRTGSDFWKKSNIQSNTLLYNCQFFARLAWKTKEPEIL